MAFLEYGVDAHLSGCGIYLFPPVNTPFRIFREGLSQRRSGPGDAPDFQGVDGVPDLVLEGIISEPRRYLDWDIPIGKPITYRFEVTGKNGETSGESFTIQPTPMMTYSAVRDGDVMDAPNPRDALQIFLSTRLAQLTAQQVVYVGDTSRENHALKFPVRSDYEFQEMELPLVRLDYEDGESSPGDLGYNFAETSFKVDGTVVAASREERDSLRQAIIGLQREIDYFLEDLGCWEFALTNLKNGIQGKDGPPLYTLDFSISGTYAVWGNTGGDWTMLQLTEWR